MSSYDPEERAFGAIRMAWAMSHGKWISECHAGHRIVLDAGVDPPSTTCECPACQAAQAAEREE
jgi:hypothetical protein